MYYPSNLANNREKRWHAPGPGVGMLLFILAIVLMIALVGSIPKWPHSRGWGYYPSGGVGLVLVILLVLYLLGRL
jgi:Protein of unknown function (DUF3309)